MYVGKAVHTLLIELLPEALHHKKSMWDGWAYLSQFSIPNLRYETMQSDQTNILEACSPEYTEGD